MNQIFLDLISHFTYIIVFVFMILNHLLPLLPTEIVLILSGVFTTISNLSIFYIVLFSTLGSYLGAMILYYVGGMFISLDQIQINPYLHRFGFPLKYLLDIKDKMNQYGNIVVFIGRFLPIIHCLISLYAGMIHMSVYHFSLMSIVGTFLWNSMFVLLGCLLGNKWSSWKGLQNDMILLFICSVIIIGFCVYKRKSKR